MAFFRFSRDKRGYENFYLVEPTTRRGKSRTRVIYWFRSPPNVRVGRQPFDAAVRRALESHYPNVAFDWKTIVEAPIPSADTENWRERRRVERAIRQAASLDDAADPPNVEADDSSSELGTPAAASGASVAAVITAAVVPEGASTPPTLAGDATRRKRRRRRGRRSGESGPEPQPGNAGTRAEPLDPAARREPVGD